MLKGVRRWPLGPSGLGDISRREEVNTAGARSRQDVWKLLMRTLKGVL